MKRAVSKQARAAVFALGLSLMAVAPAGLGHPLLDFDLDTRFSGSGPLPQSTPSLTFANLAGGNGVLMLVSGMMGAEFIDALAFNYGGSATPVFTFQSGARAETTTLAADGVALGPPGQGGEGFDVLFDYPDAAATRFSGDNFTHSLYTITGANIDESDFNLTNPSGFFAAAQIQGGPGGPAGDFVAAAVPEAQTYVMLLAGLGLLGFVMSRRRKSVAPAV